MFVNQPNKAFRQAYFFSYLMPGIFMDIYVVLSFQCC